MAVIKRLRLRVLFPVIGAVVSFLYYNALQQGNFVQWIPLGKPPSDKVIKVIRADYVETISGNVYYYKGNWIKSEEALPSIHSLYWIPMDRCSTYFELPSLDKFVDWKMACKPIGANNSGIYLTITAIDSGGSVYSWEHGVGELEGKFLGFATIAGAIRGFLVFIPVWLLAKSFDLASELVRWVKKKKSG